MGSSSTNDAMDAIKFTHRNFYPRSYLLIQFLYGGFMKFVLIMQVVFSLSAFAGTPAENYCAYLHSLIRAAAEEQKNSSGSGEKSFEEMMAFKLIERSLGPIESKAIADKKTFEEFKALAKAQGKDVANYYKRIYLTNYSVQHCQVTTTEGTLDLNTGANSQTIHIKQQFNPTGHAYYEDFKKNLPTTK